MPTKTTTINGLYKNIFGLKTRNQPTDIFSLAQPMLISSAHWKFHVTIPLCCFEFCVKTIFLVLINYRSFVHVKDLHVFCRIRNKRKHGIEMMKAQLIKCRWLRNKVWKKISIVSLKAYFIFPSISSMYCFVVLLLLEEYTVIVL